MPLQGISESFQRVSNDLRDVSGAFKGVPGDLRGFERRSGSFKEFQGISEGHTLVHEFISILSC